MAGRHPEIGQQLWITSCCEATLCISKWGCWQYTKISLFLKTPESLQVTSRPRNTKDKIYLAATNWHFFTKWSNKLHCYSWCFMGCLWVSVLPTLDNHPWFLVITKTFLVVDNRTRWVTFEAARTSIKTVCLLIKSEWQFHKKCSKFVQISYYVFVKRDHAKSKGPNCQLAQSISKNYHFTCNV